MKASTTAAKQTIQREYVVRSKLRLIAEWEHNRYSPIASITESPARAGDEFQKLFPLDVVNQPNRPAAGIAKARLGEGNLRAEGQYRDKPKATRYYTASEDAFYKYWSSVQRSSLAAGGDGGYSLPTAQVISLLYTAQVWSNKLVIGFETGYSQPQTYSVQVTTDGTTWTTIASNPGLNSSGQIVLYRQANGQWLDTPDYVNPVRLRGVRVTVNSLKHPYVHVDLVQMGLRLESDISDFIIDYDKTIELSERSFIAPIGEASSNEASITLSNIDQRFNNENTGSLYYGLIDKRVRMTLDIGIDTTNQGGAGFEYLREFTGTVDSWSSQTQTEVQAKLTDDSTLLQEIKTPSLFFEGLTIGAIIYQMLDLIGFTNYAYTKSALDNAQVIPFFWTDTEETVWDTIKSLSEGTQTAVYFDEYNVMQIETRQEAFNVNKAIDWNFDAVNNGLKLPDVIKMDVSRDMEANSVEVTYKPTKYSDFNNGFPKMEAVWEPTEETVTLRSSPLTRSMGINDMDFAIIQKEAEFWPYESLINIEGEVLRYKGKEYMYYQANHVIAYTIVTSQDQKKAIDAASSDLYGWKNSFTGKIIATERGVGGTIRKAHFVDDDRYYGAMINLFTTKYIPMRNFGNYWLVTGGNGYHEQGQPGIGMSTEDAFTLKSSSVVLPKANFGSPSSDGTSNYYNSIWYGTRFRFPSKTYIENYAIGGMFFGGGSGRGGYYVEVSPTSHVERYGRSFNSEVSLYIMPDSGPWRWFGATAPVSILFDQWYEMDIRWTRIASGEVYISIYINGVLALNWGIINSAQPTNTGQWGMMMRGPTIMQYDYIYALGAEEIAPPDQSTFLDLVNGGFQSGFIEREAKYGWTSNYRNGYYETYSKVDLVFDEFGPVVHEMREFDVKFDDDKSPVIHSYPYFTNERQVAILDYQSSPYGAKFTLVNASRDNAVVKGEDTITFGADNPVTQSLFVYGRNVLQEDDKSVTTKDEPGIRKRGITEVEFTSPWIQTEAAANELAEWVKKLWATGVDEISAEIFGNPLIQVGDLVTMNHPLKGMVPATHKYFVVSVRNSYETGMTSSVILRRARI